jgi:C-terminal processing protease CtpA/Prc
MRMKRPAIVVHVIASLLVGCVAQEETEMCTPPDRVVGIGMQLKIADGQVVIEAVLPDKPAARAGLTAGLVVRKIDGTATTGTDLGRWVEMIRGEAGTTVALEVFDPSDGSTRTVEAVREQVITKEQAL